MAKNKPFPVVYEGELDEMNNQWTFNVQSIGPNGRKSGTFQYSLPAARKIAGRLRREGHTDIKIVGSPDAGGGFWKG